MTTVTTGRQPELAGQTVVLIGGSVGMGLDTARRVSGGTTEARRCVMHEICKDVAPQPSGTSGPADNVA